MIRGNFIGGLLAACLLAALAPDSGFAQTAPRTQPVRVTPPKVTPPRVVLAIRPSQAAMIAQRVFTGAKVLGVKPRGKKYVVTLKVQNEVKQVTVDGETGNAE
jgi:hypothetical protein